MKYIKKNSPNYYKGRDGHALIMVVNHISEGNEAGGVSWLCNPASEVSSHFFIARNGTIYYLVELTDSAWCNGTQTNHPSGACYAGNSKNLIVREKWANANYFTASIEHEGIYAHTGGALTEVQYQATLAVHKFIIAEAKRLYGVDFQIDRDHIIGHCEIDPKGKPYCPGREFPFYRLITDLKEQATGMGMVESFVSAIREEALFGWHIYQVLPSITIAQAILESASGTSELAIKANALFGIKANMDWKGKTYDKMTTEHMNGREIQVRATFRAYDSWEESIMDHGEYLVNRGKDDGSKRFSRVLGEMDYKKAAWELSRAGYATDPDYPVKLISIIEKYELHLLDFTEVDDIDRSTIILYNQPEYATIAIQTANWLNCLVADGHSCGNWYGAKRMIYIGSSESGKSVYCTGSIIGSVEEARKTAHRMVVEDFGINIG